MTRAERWALGLLATGTAVFLPFALNRFVFPKLTGIAVGVLLATLVPARGRLPRSAVAILISGGLLLVAAALTGATPLAQLVGRPPRYEGLFVLPIYAAAFAVGARLLGPGRARGSTVWFLRWLAIAALAVGVEALLEAAGIRPLPSSVSRPGSLLGNASDEGAWALLALGPLAAVAVRVGGRLYLAGALAAAATLVCSGSRGALLGGLATAAVLFALAPRPAVRVAIAAMFAGVVLAAFALPATRVRVTDTSARAAETVSGRMLLAGETVRLAGAHPLFGVGPSGYLDAIPAYHTSRYEREIGPANPPDSPHDWVLQAAVAGGLILALLALLAAGLILKRGWRATRAQASAGEGTAVGGMLAGLVGYGVALLFHFTSPGTTPLAALLAGALVAEDLRLSGVPRRLRVIGRHTAQVGLIALVVLLAGAAAAELPLRAAIDAAARGNFAAANSDFRLAQTLRPWDVSIAATAGHAYAALAADGVPSAPPAAAPWISEELAGYPRSIQALADAATVDLLTGRGASARRMLSTALEYDPRNPDLLAAARRAAHADR